MIMQLKQVSISKELKNRGVAKALKDRGTVQSNISALRIRFKSESNFGSKTSGKHEPA